MTGTDIYQCGHSHSRCGYAPAFTLLPTVGFWAAAHNLLIKSRLPLLQFRLLPWQCKQWEEEEEEWRVLTSLWDPTPTPLQALLSSAATQPGHEDCILRLRLGRLRGTSSSHAERCRPLSECLFCNWSKQKKLFKNITQHFEKLLSDGLVTRPGLSCQPGWAAAWVWMGGEMYIFALNGR